MTATHSQTSGPPVYSNKPTNYNLQTTEIERIADLVSHHNLTRIGFLIYRCTYSDDFAWNRFITYLTSSTTALVRHELPELANKLSWTVLEDQKSFENATKDSIRAHFRSHVASQLIPSETSGAGASTVAKWENPRWKYCVAVDARSLRSTVQALDQPTEYYESGEPIRMDMGYVNLIRADDSWDHPDYSTWNWDAWKAGEAERAKAEAAERGYKNVADYDYEDHHDELMEEVEGSRMVDVGWMRVEVGELFPGLYEGLVEDHFWDGRYARPPEILTEGYIGSVAGGIARDQEGGRGWEEERRREAMLEDGNSEVAG